MKDLAHINKYFLKYKYHLIFGTFFIIIANVFGIVPAVVVRYSFDLIYRSYDIYETFSGFGLQESTFSVFASSVIILAVMILTSALLRGIFMFFMRQSIIEDVSKVRMYIGPAIMYGINLVTLFLMVIPFMFSINAKLTLYALIPLPLLSISIYFVNNIINKRSEEIQKSVSNLSTFVQESFSGIRVIKSFIREKATADDFERESNDYKDKSLKLAFVNALFFPLVMGLIGLSVILTVYGGSIEVLNGKIGTGVIAEFIIYVNMLTWPVASLGWIISIIQRAAASQKRINEFLETKNDILSTEHIERDIAGAIVFDKVNFTYEDSGIVALKDISFSVHPGESIAIIGTTGSGKSTIANLIARLYDTTAGAIKIDEIDIKA